VSVSPAIAIVMANLLNTEAELLWDWQGFETTVMLSELKRVVANYNDIPIHPPDRPVLELLSRLPAQNNASTCLIPVVSRYNVVLNAPQAPYADVIAPYRLVQAKFSKKFSKSKVVLDLEEELDKMGLLKNTVNCSLQQDITSRLYEMWEGLVVAPPPSLSIPFEMKATPDRFECYPFNTLTTPQSVEQPAVLFYNATLGRIVVTKSEAKRLYASDENRQRLVSAVQAMNELGPLRAFHEHRPITAVFATNGESFRIKKTKQTKAFTIERKDVDWQGKLKDSSQLDEFVELRDNVEIRFPFF